MDDCIFCKIVAGEIPAQKVYEDDNALAFLDVSPTAQGHTLVIPKKHFENIFDIDDDDLKELAVAIKKVSNLIKKNLGATGINIMNNNGVDAHQAVPHLHFHIIPRLPNDHLLSWPEVEKNYKEENFEEIAKKIRGE